ncbi:MAG: FimV/HubP family polar landmark protein [Stenotrophomonas sp.]|uniref:FimV/HubP family polar landmark protein n=1 Tax=Stenotrophomonas sp. TaxID=69392 RepID=UPI0029AB21D6|nr:FimV/HubP family polar landmark protein [Stenotrophomonas sp.]MDX3932075.1 FimV/HubP family polar landmark protein [Stenotrophomonas sp.]
MNNGARGVMRPLKYLSTLLLALASSSAMALGLGDIRVLSRPGQPLVAEIPIISADPSELQNLRVGLASPVTFERVGLQRPTGLVSELQFELTRTAQGRAVVRVTSASPVETPALAFLIEADWGQGRLVREYSALMDAPTSAVALSEPEIEAPAGAMSNAIIREPQAVPAQLPPETSTAAAAPAPAARTNNTASPRAPVPEATGAAGDIAVRQGQTLSQIAQSLAVGQQISRERAMIALLRANPEAFIRGNINLLKQGAVLRVPDAASLAAVDGSEAAAMVREHAAQWRQSRTLPQPAAADSSVAAATPAPAAAAARSSGARLEIAPAVAAAAATAGSTTGTGDGNEGDMLGNEQLRQAREDVATRDAEIDELKQRVADLEKLKAQQQALVSLKDTEIAAAQARLAETPQQASSGPWFWLALPLLLLVAVGWWLSRRRKPSPLPPLRRDDHDDSALSAAVPAGAGLDVLAERAGWEQDPREQADADTDTDTDTGIAGQAPVHFDLETPVSVSTAAPAATEPFLEPEPVVDPVPAYARHAEQQDAFRGVFELPAGDAPAAPEISDDAAAHAPDAAAATPAHAGGHDRLELAIAYLDLGDAQTARSLLEEVARSDDPHLQAQARELLARLG